VLGRVVLKERVKTGRRPELRPADNLCNSPGTDCGRGTVDDVIFNALGAAIGGITFFAPRAV
jgi:hypothetical protein